ncbi:CARDB domain-containing protein [Caldisericum sp.]|uniref:CARDB domain-containing protein n=1 Tax=Caldisericum sp. TaxID=2499687 RepID=UPI003D0F6157
MKRLTVFLVSIFLGLGLGTAYAQMKPGVPAQLKPNIPAKTYWCAKIEDIIMNPPNFTTGDQISVGVRIKLWKETIIPGAPGVKKCNCAVEPVRVTTVDWYAIMSLRLIGIKYSETETNLLQYYGSTPSPHSYTYGGFPVIAFVVTDKDVEKGYIDVWGWAPIKNPLKDNREFTIYASLDASGYALKKDNDSDYLKKGCFPPHDGGYEGDFRKTFKPKPKVSELKKEVIEKGVNLPGVLRNIPDLKIAGLESSYKIGGEDRYGVPFDDFTMKISIQNSGNSDISRFKILIERRAEGENQYHPERYSGWAYDKSQGTIENGIFEVENLKAGGTKVIFIYADNSRSPKSDHYFRIVIDPYNEIAESDESDNKMSEIFFPSHHKHPEQYKKTEQSKSNLPDLVVEGKILEINAESTTLSIRVTNKGEKDVTKKFNILIEEQICGESIYVIAKELQWTEARVGWPKTTTIEIGTVDCPSKREVRIIVDSKNDVNESNESNNLFSLELPPIKKVNLRILNIIGLERYYTTTVTIVKQSDPKKQREIEEEAEREMKEYTKKSPIRVRVYCDGNLGNSYEQQWAGDSLDFEIAALPAPDGKLKFEIWVLYKGNDTYEPFNFDPNGGGIEFVYDIKTGSFSGDVSGKIGDKIESKGNAGTIIFSFPKFKSAPAKAK